MTAETTPQHNPPNPAGCIILLHGLGASGDDLFPLAAQIDGGRRRVICPHAPVRAVTINGGMPMRAWYDITAADLAGRQDKAGVLESAQTIEQIIAAEKSRGFPANQITLAGFSQGAAMALHCGIRHNETLAGIVALSGYLLFAGKLAEQATQASRQTPIFQGHGIDDDVVLPEWARMSRDVLAAGGWDIDYKEYPAGHGIHPRAIVDLNNWLAANART